jgi:hypothetical protein
MDDEALVTYNGLSKEFGINISRTHIARLEKAYRFPKRFKPLLRVRIVVPPTSLPKALPSHSDTSWRHCLFHSQKASVSYMPPAVAAKKMLWPPRRRKVPS